MTSRQSQYIGVAVLGLAGLACLLAGSFEWVQRGVMIADNPPEAAEQVWFTLELLVAGALNLLLAAAWLVRRSERVWWVAVGLQAMLLVVAIAEGAVTDIGWFYFAALPVLTGAALVACRSATRGPSAYPAAGTSRQSL